MKIVITKNNLRRIIDKYRKENSMTLTDIARELDMFPQRLDQYCNANNMLFSNALMFSEYLDCELEDIFDYSVID